MNETCISIRAKKILPKLLKWLKGSLKMKIISLSSKFVPSTLSLTLGVWFWYLDELEILV